MNFDFLAQPQGVQLPDPAAQFGKALTLSDLARRNRVGAMDEENAVHNTAAARAYEAALPDLMRGGFSADAVTSAVTANPNAAGAILKETDARRKAALDQEKTGADTDKLKAETRKIDLAMVGGIAQSIVSNPNAQPRDLETLGGIMKRVGIDPMAFGDYRQDPKAWLQGVAGASIDAAKQLELAETKRTNVATQAEMVRGHDLTAATAREGHAVTERGQTLLDARAREKNSIDAQGLRGQPEEIMVDGKPVLAIFDKRSGTFYDANTREAIKGGIAPKAQPLPGTVVQSLAQNEVTLSKIDRALQLVKEQPDAFGLKNYAGDTIMQRAQPEGVTARALVADIAGQKIHDRSGAAVTVGEMERLKPYIPNVTDSPEAVKQKLMLFRREYALLQQELAQGRSLAEMVSAKRGSPGATGDFGDGGPLKPNSDGSFDYVPGGKR